jgi:hypothetical protein
VNPAAWTAEVLWRSLHGAKRFASAKPTAGDLFFISVANPLGRASPSPPTAR